MIIETILICLIDILINRIKWFKKKIGDGDVDLIICIVLLFNLFNASIIILISSITALIYLSIKGKLRIIPFVPFLYFGNIVFFVVFTLKFSLY